MARPAPFLLLLVLAGPASAAGEPQRYPDFDWDTAASHVVLATLERGEDIEMDLCETANEGNSFDPICITNIGAYRLKAEIRTSLKGGLLPGTLFVSSKGHVGRPAAEELEGETWLVQLLADGGSYVMPARAREWVVRSRAGEWYLPLYDEQPPDWLPCGVAALREEIHAGDFDRDIAVPREHYLEAETDVLPSHLYLTPAGVVPRFAISMTRLRSYLSSLDLPSGPEAMGCGLDYADR